MTISPVSRLNQPQQSVVAANGNCTLTFAPPPLGQQNTGTITVWNSPHGVVWEINLNQTAICTTVGASPVGNIQQQDTDTLTLTSSGLQPGTIIQATYVGTQEDKSQGAVVAPDGSSIVSIQANAARVALGPLAGSISSTGTTFTVNLLPTDRRVLVALDAPLSSTGTVNIQLQGNQTSIIWTLLLPRAQIIGGPNGGILEIPIYGSLDSSATLTLTPGSTANATVTVLAFSDEYNPGTPENPLSVVDSLGTYTGIRTVVANGGAGSVFLAAPPAGFATQIAMAGVWSNGVPTAAVNVSLFGASSLVDLAGGFTTTNGAPFIDRRSFSGLTILEGVSSASQTSGVGMVSEIFYRTVPVLT